MISLHTPLMRFGNDADLATCRCRGDNANLGILEDKTTGRIDRKTLGGENKGSEQGLFPQTR